MMKSVTKNVALYVLLQVDDYNTWHCIKNWRADHFSTRWRAKSFLLLILNIIIHYNIWFPFLSSYNFIFSFTVASHRSAKTGLMRGALSDTVFMISTFFFTIYTLSSATVIVVEAACLENVYVYFCCCLRLVAVADTADQKATHTNAQMKNKN